MRFANLAKRLVPVALLLGLVGCDDIGPGDYVVYRVGFQPASQSGDCVDSATQPSVAEDTSTLLTNAVFILYVGTADCYYLDTGSETLQGTESGGTFQFDGMRSDVNFMDDGMGAEIRVQLDETLSIQLKRDGAAVEGTHNRTTSSQCSGAGQCPDPPAATCTEARPFVGGEVEDVELKHEV